MKDYFNRVILLIWSMAITHLFYTSITTFKSTTSQSSCVFCWTQMESWHRSNWIELITLFAKYKESSDSILLKGVRRNTSFSINIEQNLKLDILIYPLKLNVGRELTNCSHCLRRPYEKMETLFMMRCHRNSLRKYVNLILCYMHI